MTRDFASKFQAFYQFLFSERVVRVRPTVLGASASSLVKTPEIFSHYSVKNFRDLNSLSSCATNTVFRSHLRPRVRVVRSNNKRKEVNWHSSQSKSAYRSWNRKLLACLSCGIYKPAYHIVGHYLCTSLPNRYLLLLVPISIDLKASKGACSARTEWCQRRWNQHWVCALCFCSRRLCSGQPAKNERFFLLDNNSCVLVLFPSVMFI